MWVDIYDEEAWADPAAAAADMGARGVRTLFLQTSNADRAGSFVFPEATAAFVDAAHDAGILVVAWYLPGLRDLATDRRRVVDALAFRTARGDAFDGFGLDIESEAVGDPFRRTERLVRLSSEIRGAAGAAVPAGRDRALARSSARRPRVLAGFPWHDLALTYDAILPMTYFTFRANGPAETAAYVAGCIDEIRAGVGSDAVAIDVIGGLASDATEPETRAFVRILGARRVAGGGWYSWPDVTDGAVGSARACALRRRLIDPPRRPRLGFARPGPQERFRSRAVQTRVARVVAIAATASPWPRAAGPSTSTGSSRS